LKPVFVVVGDGVLVVVVLLPLLLPGRNFMKERHETLTRIYCSFINALPMFLF